MNNLFSQIYSQCHKNEKREGGIRERDRQRVGEKQRGWREGGGGREPGRERERERERGKEKGEVGGAREREREERNE